MKTALVTGSARGIGAATAALLAEKGYSLCINYIEREDRATELEHSLRKKGFSVISHRADVADPAEVEEMVRYPPGSLEKDVRGESRRMHQRHPCRAPAHAA